MLKSRRCAASPFLVLAKYPDSIKEKPETLRKVAHAICGAVQISRNDPKHSKVLMALEYPHVEPKTNDGAYNIVSQIDEARQDDGGAGASYVRLSAAQRAGGGRLRDDSHQRLPAE